MTVPTRFAPLRYPAFRQLVAAKTATTVGSWMQLVWTGRLMLKLTGSATSVGVIMLASRGPGVVMAVEPGLKASTVAGDVEDLVTALNKAIRLQTQARGLVWPFSL